MKADLQRKKQIYQRSIRNQQINEYFATRRLEARQTQEEDQGVCGKVKALLDQLPSSIQSISDQLNERMKVVSVVLIKEIGFVCERMAGAPLVEWSHFVYAVNRLLVATADIKQLQHIINTTLLPVLDGAEMQLEQASNSVVKRKIMRLLLEYCYRLGRFVKGLQHFEQKSLFSTMNVLWECEWEQEQEECLLQTCLNIFSSNFDPQDAQNVSNQERMDLEYFKIKFVAQVFFKNSKEWVARLLRKMFGLVLGEELNSHLLGMYLRLLINFTKYIQDTSYYYFMLQHNLLQLISAILYNHLSQSTSILIYTLRLMNNILVNEITLTLQILREIMAAKLVSIHQQLSHNPEVQQEIASLFINIIHYLNDESEPIREMITIGVPEILFEVLEREESGEDQLVMEAVSAIGIMFDHNPIQVKKLLREHERLLRKAVEQHSTISVVLENLLQSCQMTPKSL